MRASILVASVLVACGGKPATHPTAGSATEPAKPTEITKPAEPDEKAETPTKPIDAKAAQDASRAFLDVISGSRDAIKACWLKARVANPALDKPVTLTITASFRATGELERATFTPAISPDFEACAQGVAKAWKLQLPQSMTFKAQVALTPS